MAIDYDAILKIWQPASSRPLTHEDGREIAENVVGLFRLLSQWAEQDAALAAPGVDGASNDRESEGGPNGHRSPRTAGRRRR